MQTEINKLTFEQFTIEDDLKRIMELCEYELSEPYSIYTFRYFIYQFPTLTIIAKLENKVVGVIVGRIDQKKSERGYIAMLVVDKQIRNLGLGTKLLDLQLKEFTRLKADEVILETEKLNFGALKLYEKFGFQREKFLESYYMNSGDAFRLKLFLNYNKQRFD